MEFPSKKDQAISEYEFYRSVNVKILGQTTPLYNTFILIFSVMFAYFALMEQPQCYARDDSAWATEYSNTADVTAQFHQMAQSGAVLLPTSAFFYYLQSNDGLFDMMRPITMLINLCVFIWFCLLQYYRFRAEGMACSGDYLTSAPDPNSFYLKNEGRWFLFYIIA